MIYLWWNFWRLRSGHVGGGERQNIYMRPELAASIRKLDLDSLQNNILEIKKTSLDNFLSASDRRDLYTVSISYQHI